jgi:hypothetical protein
VAIPKLLTISFIEDAARQPGRLADHEGPPAPARRIVVHGGYTQQSGICG